MKNHTAVSLNATIELIRFGTLAIACTKHYCKIIKKASPIIIKKAYYLRLIESKGLFDFLGMKMMAVTLDGIATVSHMRKWHFANVFLSRKFINEA